MASVAGFGRDAKKFFCSDCRFQNNIARVREPLCAIPVSRPKFKTHAKKTSEARSSHADDSETKGADPPGEAFDSAATKF